MQSYMVIRCTLLHATDARGSSEMIFKLLTTKCANILFFLFTQLLIAQKYGRKKNKRMKSQRDKKN